MTSPDQLFPSDQRTRAIARDVYTAASDLPLVCPHGHVDPSALAEDRPFTDPASLIVVPDHYILRMLHSQGIPPDRMGVPALDDTPVETNGRTIWRRLATNWYLFRGTPSRLWTERVLQDVFGVEQPLGPETADDIYDQISARLATPEYRPRALFTRFNIETLATTEQPLDELVAHRKLAADGWGGPGGRVVTTFRPDNLVDLSWPGWSDRIADLAALTGQDTTTFAGYLTALRIRREAFIAAGATCTDHGNATPTTWCWTPEQAAELYAKGLAGTATVADAHAFEAGMLVEFARMSIEDGLVMQLHPGCLRNHNRALFARHGRDVGGDIPTAVTFVDGLRPLLDEYGNNPRLRMVLFTLDESTFTRELAPLAGGYPSLFLGAPWWFLDTPDSLRRFRENVTDSAGFYNTAGFVDDTRAFCSIPVRHDVARRIDAGYLARLVAEHRLDLDEAQETMRDLAYHLPKRVFRLEQ